MTNDFKPAKAGGNQPRLSKEEYAEKKRAEKEKIYQMIDDAAREIVSDPEKFKSFLDTQSRMDRYSAANALLIYSQYPQATQLKDFNDWGKDNVKITKGAKSVSILEPVEYTRADGSPGISYNVKKVFDVTQTNGRKAPAVSANRDPKALITTMLDVSPVEVASTDELPYPNMAAFYNNEKQTLYVKRNVGDSVAVAQCVAQELGHAQLSINSESYSRRDMGFQAVCIGYMLCKKYGVDTQNFAINRIPEGLASKEPKEIRAELSKTRNAMAEIHSHTLKEEYDIGASFYLVGSGARNLILQNANQPIDLDYNLEITRIDDWEDCKEIKECVRKAFNIVLREYGWSDCQDSTSSLTTEKRHFNQGNSTEFSMDICIVCEDTDGNYHRLIHDKRCFPNRYFWNQAPNSRNIREKAKYIKEKGKWTLVREQYLKIKKQYLTSNDYNHSSFICYIEAVNNVYNSRKHWN